jgi:hypothetical protein
MCKFAGDMRECFEVRFIHAGSSRRVSGLLVASRAWWRAGGCDAGVPAGADLQQRYFAGGADGLRPYAFETWWPRGSPE